MNGKGSTRRPSQASEADYAARWEETFRGDTASIDDGDPAACACGCTSFRVNEADGTFVCRECAAPLLLPKAGVVEVLSDKWDVRYS